MSLLLAIQARLASDYAGVFNLVPDPSFEAADLSQWSVLNGATLAQSTSNATSRTNSLRVQGTTFNQGAQITVPTVPGQTYRVRADVFIATGGAGVEAALGFDGTNFSTSPGATGAFTLTVQIAATGTSTSLVLASSGSGGTFDFYFDAVAVVPTTDSVPYFDGGTTGDWLGTPDHSASRLSDVAARAVRNLGRTAPDALATHDAAARGVQLPRTAPDSLGTSDAATRVSAQARAAGDYASVLNLIPNPSFEGADLSQWTITDPRTLTPTQSTLHATSRTNSMRIQGTGNAGVVTTVPVIPGQRYYLRASIYVAAIDPGGGSTVGVFAASGVNRAVNPGDQVTIAVPTAPAAGSTQTVSISASSDGFSVPVDFYVDSVALIPITGTDASYPYFDGGTTGDWIGTPEYSASRLSDVATRVQSLPRTAPDSLGTHDAVARTVFRGLTASDSLGTSDAAARGTALPRTTADRLATRDDDRNLFVYQSYEGGLLPSPLGGGLAVPNFGSTATLAVTDSTDSISGSKSLELTVTPQLGTSGVIIDLNHFGPNNSSLTPGDTRNIRVVPGQQSAGTGMVKIVSTTGGNVTQAGFGTSRYHADGSQSGSGSTDFAPTVGVWTSRVIQPPGLSATEVFVSPALHLAFDSTTTQIVLRLDQLLWREDGGVGGVSYFDGDTPGAVWEGGAGLGPSRIGHAVRAIQSFPRIAADSLGTHDAATQTRIFPRTASDSLGTSDAAARSLALSRAAPDWLGTDDVYRNYVLDPSFESSTAGVRLVGGGVTISATIVSDPLVGTSAAEITWNGSGNNNPTPTFALNIFGASGSNLDPTDPRNISIKTASVQALTLISFKIVSVTGGTVTNAHASRSRFSSTGVVQGGANSSGIANPVTGTWYQDSLQVLTVDPFVSPAIQLAVTSGVTQVVVHVDRVLFAIAPANNQLPPDYFDGSSGPGAGWSGTPNASTSSLTIGTRVAKNLGRTGADSLGTTDSAARSLQLPRTTSDSLGTTDSAVGSIVGSSPNRTTADSLGTSDAATQLVTLPRAAADALATSDAATRTSARPRTTGDALGTSDAASRQSQTFPRTSADTLGTADTATRLLTTTRTAADSLGTSDAAARIRSAPRTATERLATRDYDRNLAIYQGYEGGFLPAVNGGGIATPNSPNISVVAAASSDAFSGTGSLELTLTVSGTSGTIALNHFGTNTVLNTSDSRNLRVGADQLSRGGVTAKVVSATGGTVTLLAGAYMAYNASGGSAGASSSGGSSNPPVGTWVTGFSGTPTSPFASPALFLTWDAGTTQIVLRVDNVLWLEDWDPHSTPTFFDGSSGGAAWEGSTGLGPSRQDHAARAVQSFQRTAPDSLGTTDAAARAVQLPRAAADSLGTSDAATRSFARIRTAADTLGTSDVATRLTAYTRTSADTLGTNDSATRHIVLVRSASDALGTTDAATRTQAFARTGSDTLGTSDAAAKIVIRSRTSADTLGTSDAATRPAILRIRTGSDTLGTSDAAVTQSAHNLVRASADSLGTHDAATRAALALSRSGSDTLGTRDASTRIVVQIRSSADALVFTDAAARVRISARTTADSLGTSDAAARSFIRSRTGSDTLGTSDAATRVRFSVRTASDSLGTSDVASPGLRVRTATDTLGTSDSAIATRGHARTSTDTLGTTDAVATRRALFRLASDTLGTSDAVSRQQTLVTAAADSLATTDAATRAYLAIKFGSDVTTVSDAAERGIALSGRLALDALLTSDDATRGTLWARLAFDSLLTNDFVRAAPAPLTYISSGHASPLYAAGGKGEQADARGYVTPTIEP